MEDLPVVDGQDESIGDGLNGLIEIGLTGKDIDHRLRQEWGVSRDGCGGDRVEWDWQGGRLGWHGGW